MLNYLQHLRKSYINSYLGLPFSCWQGIFLSLVESTLMGVFYFLSIYFVNVLHLDIATSGKIISCYGVGAIVGGYLGGKLSDLFSPKKTIAYSLFLQATGYILLIIINAPHCLMINLFLLGTSTYSFITANYVWVLEQCKTIEAQRLKAINLLSTSSNLGLGISAVFVSLMTENGFQYIFAISGIIILILSLHIFFLNSFENQTTITTVEDVSFKPKDSFKVSKSNQKLLLIVLSCVLFVGAIVSQLSSTYPLYVNYTFPEYGINAVGLLFALNSAIVILFEVPIGNMIGRINKLLLVGFSSFLIGFGMLMLSFSPSFLLAILSCIVYTLGEIIFFCIAQLICYEKANNSRKGYGLGIYRMVYASSRVLGPLGGSFMYYHFGGEMVWYVSGIIGVIAVIVCYFYRKYD